MAITMDGIERAEVTYVFEESSKRLLPWGWVQFADPGEERRYLVTRGGDGFGLTVAGAQPYRVVHEFAPNRPFPLEANRPRNQAGDAPGDFAVHWIAS